MRKPISILVWFVVAAVGAMAVATIALHRGEQINAMWLVVAAVCSYALGYRFYSKFVAAKVLALDGLRATPAERLENGRDFVPTNKWVVFGHHFAAIAGPGPLVGPVLAAQFGYLPGTLWILAGAVFGGCVQDFVILLFSVRRDGKSLTEMAKSETGRLGGFIAYVAVISIIVILLGVAALIVVNALKASPWGTFTIAMTIPIALFMGLYLRRLRPGKVIEASALGFVLVLAAIFAGKWVSESAVVGHYFTLSATTLAMLIIAYGYAASALPVWLLLAPRDYLSTFVKLGTIALLAAGIVAIRPTLHMPALTRFVDGTGPVFAGNVFPFAFITIACGAISGFHSLISSGTTPKLITRETETRMVGYGADGGNYGYHRCMRAAAGHLFRDQRPSRYRRPGTRSSSHGDLELGFSGDRRGHAYAGPGGRRADALQPDWRSTCVCGWDGTHLCAQSGRTSGDGDLVPLCHHV
jgi:carbon starvation protein